MHEDRLVALQGAEQREIRRAAETADEGVDLFLRGELGGDGGRGVGLGLGVLGQQLDLAAEEAAGGVDLLGGVLDAPEDLRAAARASGPVSGSGTPILIAGCCALARWGRLRPAASAAPEAQQRQLDMSACHPPFSVLTGV